MKEETKTKNIPTGIPSHFLWIEDRIWELKKAIKRFEEADCEELIPKEWAKEIYFLSWLIRNEGYEY